MTITEALDQLSEARQHAESAAQRHAESAARQLAESATATRPPFEPPPLNIVQEESSSGGGVDCRLMWLVYLFVL